MNAFPGLPVPEAFVSEPFALIVGAIATVIVLPYLLGPLLVKETHKTRSAPTLIAFDPDEHPAPPAVQEFLDDAEAALWSCGFEVLAHVALPDLVPNVTAIFVLLTRPESNDSAMAVAAFAKGGALPMKKHFVEFATDYVDGFELCTNNFSDESAYCPLPHKRVLQCDFLSDPEALWRFHERAAQAYGTGPKTAAPTPQTAIDRLREGLLKENTDQVAVGWVWYDEENEAFRPTWKGACLMTWKLCWPVSMVRRAARRKRAKALLQEWDLTEQVR